MTTELYEKSTLKRINIKRHTSMEEFLFLIRYPLTNTNPTFILPANMFGIRFILSVPPPHEKQYPEFFIACKCCVSFDLLEVKIGHYLFYGPCWKCASWVCVVLSYRNVSLATSLSNYIWVKILISGSGGFTLSESSFHHLIK